MSDFYKYFKENMDGLNLATPESLFSSLQVATGTANVFLGVIKQFGTRITVLEVVGAGTKLEALAVVGACSAAYYTGAVIGSLAIAAGRSLAGGTSLSDVMFFAKRHQLNPPWLVKQLLREPQLYQRKASVLAPSTTR